MTDSDIFCSHCEKANQQIVVRGKRLIEGQKGDQLLPYMLCLKCNLLLRSFNSPMYNNAPNVEEENAGRLFWEKVDATLQKNNIH